MNCCNKKEPDLTAGDNSAAFGQTLFTINLRDPDGLLKGHSISKAEVKVNGVVDKVYQNPEFPLRVNLTSEESIKLMAGENIAYLAIWDELGQKVTPEGGQIIRIGARKV